LLDNSYRLTVSQLNEYVNSILKSDSLLSHVCVSGEISGFKRHSSGHLYFSLKDEGALIRCVMFRQNAFTLDFSPQDGQSVLIYGSVSIYAKDGQYQLYVTAMERQGEGELYRRFMLMKTRLESKGYFDEGRKKPIPFLPKCVGVVTSPTGAAIQDIINVTRRRFPAMNLLLYPVRVQGEGAAEEIAEAIYVMNRMKRADVLIVGRGGGSMEDLWPFNEEIVARAIYESDIPIVSAVGHETDFSIADFTADLRAPTPSAAAELCVPEYLRLRGDIIAAQSYMMETCHKEMDNLRQRLSGIRDSAAFSMTRHRIEILSRTVEIQRDSMSIMLRSELINAIHSVEKQQSKLNALSPEAVLDRGYGMVQQDGVFVGSVDELKEKQKALLIMKNGRADITIDSISRG